MYTVKCEINDLRVRESGMCSRFTTTAQSYGTKQAAKNALDRYHDDELLIGGSVVIVKETDTQIVIWRHTTISETSEDYVTTCITITKG